MNTCKFFKKSEKKLRHNIKIIRPDEFMKILEIQEKEENRL